MCFYCERLTFSGSGDKVILLRVSYSVLFILLGNRASKE